MTLKPISFKTLTKVLQLGDTELNDYMDSLARDPNKFITPHNADTGETILHLLAKEGKVEILHNLLEDSRVEKDLVIALLKQDKLGWNPVMAATKADSGGEDLVEMFLGFLETRIEDPSEWEKLFEAKNIGHDTIFTLLMRRTDTEKMNSTSKKILFNILTRTAESEEEIHRRVLKIVQQLLTPNSCDLTARSTKEIIDLCAEFNINFEKLFSIKDEDGNTVLMELAKNMKDDALREILTNSATTNYITHTVLLSKNTISQTLLTLIEVNRESLAESLPLVLKKEYGCHRRDMIRTELCLSEQLETSASASEIIQELHQLEPKSCCQIFVVWVTLFLTSLTPNIGLAVSDIFSDAYLTVEYHSNMMNASFVENQAVMCATLKNQTPIPLEAYASCLDARSQFFYTITFLLIPLIFYLTEFLTLTPEYEPTGLRRRLNREWGALTNPNLLIFERFLKFFQLLALVAVTFVALVLWQPVTAMCKFYRDARYEASEGTIKVVRRKEKRYVDLAASRGELIEVSIEAVFEPMVQGYIIFPSIIGIIQRLANSVTVGEDGTITIDFQLKGIETAQIFSISVSMISLAWCYSEYNSVRKNMLLDVTVSPCSRVIMCTFMLFQVVARLLAFMLFTLFWGPGNFYPLMIFIAVHLIIAATFHLIFSEDVAYWRKGRYVKFFHNVALNALASIYFHNYLRFDEMPPQSCEVQVETVDSKTSDPESCNGKTKKGFVDSQRPGLHISTFLRQVTFDSLYALEYVVLLTFGFSSDVKDLIDQKRKPILISVILVLSTLAILLKLSYYNLMHVWRNVIVSGKKLIRQEIVGKSGTDSNIQKKFFKFVFISRNTWICGNIKHIETTLIVLPKRIIEAIKGRGQDLENNFTDVTRQVDRSWFDSPREFLSSLKFNSLIKFLMVFPLAILVIVINLAIIVLLLFGLVLTIPVAVLVFFYNMKSGFRAVEINDEEEGQNTLELPPEIERGETTIFQSDQSKTLVAFQRDLEESGTIDLNKKVEFTADELEVFSMLLLSLNRKRYPLKLLILDNCDLTDEKLIKLAPLIVKFPNVSMNGSQKISLAGWEKLRETVCSATSTCKLRKLELKIAKNDDDVIRFRREVLLEELKGSNMNPDSLRAIGRFLPRLEKVYLDDIYSDVPFLMDLIKNRTDTMVDAWKDVAKSVLSCQPTMKRIRCLSLPGCAITDDVLQVLAPALVRINMIHLGRNSITFLGWECLKNYFTDDNAVKGSEAQLSHLSINMLTDYGSPASGGVKYLNNAGMDHLIYVLPFLEEVDLSGQVEVGPEGWQTFADGLKIAHEKGKAIKLKHLKLAGCRIKEETRKILDDAVLKYQPTLKIDYGPIDEPDKPKKSVFCF